MLQAFLSGSVTAGMGAYFSAFHFVLPSTFGDLLLAGFGKCIQAWSVSWQVFGFYAKAIRARSNGFLHSISFGFYLAWLGIQLFLGFSLLFWLLVISLGSWSPALFGFSLLFYPARLEPMQAC